MLNAPKKIEYGKSIASTKKFELPLALNVPTLFYHCANDRNWTVSFISNACVDIFEYTKKQFMSHEISFGQLINNLDKETVWDSVQFAIKNQTTFELLYQMVTSTNTTKIIYEKGEGIFNEYGKLIELAGLLSDVTQYYLNNDYLPVLEACASEINQLITKDQKNSHGKLRALSHREVETLVHLCQGKSMKEIGIDMHISPRTVEANINHAKSKLQCHTQSELRNLFYMTDSGKRLLIELK